jgi:hypothetical protein
VVADPITTALQLVGVLAPSAVDRSFVGGELELVFESRVGSG